MSLVGSPGDDCEFSRIQKSGDCRIGKLHFLHSGHILRQLGISQGNECFGRERFELPDFDARNLLIYKYSWNDRELDGPLPDFIAWLESRYMKWLHKEIRRQRAVSGSGGISSISPRLRLQCDRCASLPEKHVKTPENQPEHYHWCSRKFAKRQTDKHHAPDGTVRARRQYRRCGSEARRRFALVISGLAAYLLVSPNGQVDPSLVSVATQLSARRNVVPMVLAEMLIGLDLASTGQIMVFGGSPLLLQLWLSDKLGLIAAPETNWPHLLGWMHQRGMLYPEMTIEEWLYPSVARDKLRVAPSRSRDLSCPAFTAQNLTGYEHNWGLRELGGANLYFNTELTNRYKA
ncbi:hypothetical protein RHMOL_Rhmol08G0160600 [Rhododendron molle]|uniref:Uncharacterized protein n=1 Tax=Rhododendron molle TaxID=49168 RepID=A0ACC0MP93_RHOML|nr:hypothetical protein RHMOL_Rhmol08G0160600 [Rhododendron molle]